MINRRLSQVSDMLASLAISSCEGMQDVVIQGVSIDTRTLQQGSLFIPIVGDRFDGHQYVEEAFQRGATAALWQADHGTPPAGLPIIIVSDTVLALQQLAESYLGELSVRVIAVTGSNGKTTTKDLLAAVLATTYKTLKTEGNLNNHLGLPLTLLQLDESHEMAVLEMGMSEFGEIELLAKLAKPEIAIITNVGEAHLMQLGSREGIAKAKLEIISGLQPGGLLIYNGDEPLLTQMVDELQERSAHSGQERMKYFRLGMAKSNDFYPTGVMVDSYGTHFTLNENRTPAYYIPLLGKHNVSNALVAIAAAKYMGVSEQHIIDGLKSAQISSMRSEICQGRNGVTIINDAYNASPSSMRAAVQLLEEMKGYRRKVIVLGDMLELGEQEQQFHEQIGRLLDPAKIDYVITSGEQASYIAEAARAKFGDARIFSSLTKDEISSKIIALTNEEDIVLLKASRGLKFEEIVDDLTYDMNNLEGGVE